MLFVIFGAALALVGCGGRINVERDGDGGLNISVALTEADVNALITDAINNQPDRLLRDVSADLQNGQIVVTGVYDRAGGESTNGSITLAASVTEGLLDVEVRDIDIEGYDADDARLADLNARIVDGLNNRANRDNNVTIQAISITDDELNLTVNVRRQ